MRWILGGLCVFSPLAFLAVLLFLRRKRIMRWLDEEDPLGRDDPYEP